MTFNEKIAVIALCALGSILSRFTPFILFGRGKEPPKIIKRLGRVLPPAVFAMLVVYCLKDIPSQPTLLTAQLAGLVATVTLHLLFGRMLLSIAAGTAAYLLLR